MEKEDIKKLVGDDYVEDMTLEDALVVVAKQKEDAKLAKDEATRLVDKYKSSNDKISSENAEYKKQNRATLTEAQQRDAEYKARIDALEANSKALIKDKEIQTNKNRFLTLGMDDTLASETANAFVENNTDVVFKNIAALKDNIINQVKSDALKNTKRPPIANPDGDDPKGITIDKFKKMSITERTNLYKTNKEAYDILKKQDN